MFHITVTFDSDSLHRIYGPTYCFTHPTDGRIQLSPTPEPILTYEAAQQAFFTASDWLDAAIREDGRADSTVTLRGPNGVFRSHSMAKSRTA